MSVHFWFENRGLLTYTSILSSVPLDEKCTKKGFCVGCYQQKLQTISLNFLETLKFFLHPSTKTLILPKL